MDDDFHVGAQSTKKVYKVHICVGLLENMFLHCAAMHMFVFSFCFLYCFLTDFFLLLKPLGKDSARITTMSSENGPARPMVNIFEHLLK